MWRYREEESIIVHRLHREGPELCGHRWKGNGVDTLKMNGVWIQGREIVREQRQGNGVEMQGRGTVWRCMEGEWCGDAGKGNSAWIQGSGIVRGYREGE